MSPILYRLRSALRQHSPRRLLLSLVVALVLGLVLTLVAGSRANVDAPDRYTDRVEGEFDVAIDQTAVPTEADRGAPAGRRVASTTFVFGFLIGRSGSAGRRGGVHRQPEAIPGTRIVAGRRSRPERADEIMVSSAFVAQTGAQIGDTIRALHAHPGPGGRIGIRQSFVRRRRDDCVVVGEFGGASDLQDGYAAALFSPALVDLGDIGLGGGVAPSS